MNIRLEFEWTALGKVYVSERGRLVIPPVPKVPGVYRFHLSTCNPVEVYIGQATNLNRRMGNYSGTHSGDTNTRIRNILLQRFLEGETIQYSIASNVHLLIDNVDLTSDLSLEYVRLLVENAGLALARNAGELAHNIA